MNWKSLFARHILERGYDYYCMDAVENLDISEDLIRADVSGTEDYEVEISLEDGEITDMYCSCPYAEDGRNCKHMAAVLYEWEDARQECECGSRDDDKEGNEHLRTSSEPDSSADSPATLKSTLFIQAHTAEAFRKKQEAIQALVEQADISIVKSYLASALAENEKTLLRFYSAVCGREKEEDVRPYIREVDRIAQSYLGRSGYIEYRQAGRFTSELGEILAEDAERMIENGHYRSAFQLMNHIFVLIGEVDMDDSDGGTGMLADEIYDLWTSLLDQVSADEKQKMFQWFTEHLDGSVIDYLEEYIERILMEGFSEKEYMPQKLSLVEDMLDKAEKSESGWSRSYAVGKWALKYLDLLEQQKASRADMERFCRQHWENSFVRRYYIDLCMKAEDYELALKALDESLVLDKEYAGLLAEYADQKKEIFLLRGDRDAYVKQLWELALRYRPGELKVYKELKAQYEEEEWTQKREKIFQALPGYADVNELYKEEGLYDRLLASVLKSPGLYQLQRYEDVLKTEYPEQLLGKYREEVEKMAYRTSSRRTYQEIAGLLRRMKKIEGGSRLVGDILADWKEKYRNRPAMMDELSRL